MEKQAFFEQVLKTGTVDKTDPLASRVLKSRKSNFPQVRLANKFELGADPEFILVYRADTSQRINAHNLGLLTKGAYGEDSNGRLIEIRPHPTRSALELVASTLETLRHFTCHFPQTLRGCHMRAGAWALDDGLGGHVHFSRRQRKADLEKYIAERGGARVPRAGEANTTTILGKSRPDDVQALDVVARMLYDAEVINPDEIRRRSQGDAHHQLYGLPGDIRIQAHGYEYRTFPSWLVSPEAAFLSITLAKLAVINPGFTNCAPAQSGLWKDATNRKAGFMRILGFLARWRGLDDDAVLAQTVAFRLMNEAQVKHNDFAPSWGLVPPKDMPDAKGIHIPDSFVAPEETVKELHDALMNGTTLPMKNFDMRKIPSGYAEIPSLNGYYTHGFVKRFQKVEDDLSELWIPKDMFRGDPKDFKSGFRIGTSIDRLTWSSKTKKLLLKIAAAGHLPIWYIDELKASSYKTWQTQPEAGLKTSREKKLEKVDVLVEVR